MSIPFRILRLVRKRAAHGWAHVAIPGVELKALLVQEDSCGNVTVSPPTTADNKRAWPQFVVEPNLLAAIQAEVATLWIADRGAGDLAPRESTL
jgi:hypothetical protein